MKYLERFLRYIFWVVVTASIAWLVKKAFQRAAGTPAGAARRTVKPSMAAEKTKALVRDPVCGTYVAEDIAYSLTQGGENFHFCSRDCMEHFHAHLHDEDGHASSRLATGV